MVRHWSDLGLDDLRRILGQRCAPGESFGTSVGLPYFDFVNMNLFGSLSQHFLLCLFQGFFFPARPEKKGRSG